MHTTNASKFDQVYRRPRAKGIEAIPFGDAMQFAYQYENLYTLKTLSNSRFPVHLTSSKINHVPYVMKVFPCEGNETPAFYKNEVRFASFNHPNIVNIIHQEDQKEVLQNGQPKKISYILMEYAPYGDFFDLINSHKSDFDEKLVRTYFKQLIDGVEYLHSKKVAHLDLKPENLLLSSDFKLKIADFDIAYVSGDANTLGRGTRYYRAPEFFKSEFNSSSGDVEVTDPFAADIYGAGVILFILRSGMYPHCEEKTLKGVNFLDLMYNNNAGFWAKHSEFQTRRGGDSFSEEFKELFDNMVKLNPKERWTLEQIKQSSWYNGPVYSGVELQDKMRKMVNS